MAGITYDGNAIVWDLTNQSGKISIQIPGKVIKTIKFKPGEKILALGCSDGSVELWNVQTGRKISGINAHTAGVNAIRFNPALQQMATAGNDKTIRIWDVRDLTAPPISMNDNEGYVMAIEFSPDGKMIISGTYEGADNLIGRAAGADILAKEVSGLITRDLTPEEWSMFIGKDIEYETLY
jgi:WD40 repeat protein